MTFSAGPAAAAMGGVLEGPDAPCDGGSIDSRMIRAGQLFFAIRGARDGHDYVEAALRAGAAGAVVEREVAVAPGLDQFLIRAPDSTAALGALARSLRLDAAVEVAAITGSVGKTTTRTVAARALGSRSRVFESPANWNNHLGVPLSILAAGDEETWVMELAMSAPGEIRGLTRIAVPDCGLVTAVSPVHLDGLGSIEAVADAKGELFESLPAESTAVVRADDPRVLAQADRFAGHRITFGFQEDVDVRGRGYERTADGLQFEARAFGGPWTTVRCGLTGAHNAGNVLAGLAVAVAMGAPLSKAVAAVATLGPLPGRGARATLAGGAVAVDETYNSSPAALMAAIEDLAATPASRRILVAGDMRELGSESEGFHARCGRHAAEAGLDRVVGVGSLGRRLAEAAGSAGVPMCAFDSPDDAADALRGELREGDVALFKASRAMGLERILRQLEAAPKAEA